MPEPKQNAPRDGNFVPVIMGVASATMTVSGVDYVAGITPVPVAVDPVTHELIVESA